MSHVETHQILSDMQFGFHKRCSAELQLLQTIHDLSLNLKNKGQTGIVLLDFSKEFDKVTHHLLLFKLEYYGIRGNILNWISSFLVWLHLQGDVWILHLWFCRCFKWVPQRLGPLLFLIYINDILQHVDCICHLYADDCILYQKIESVHDVIMLQNDLCLLEHWKKK